MTDNLSKLVRSIIVLILSVSLASVALAQIPTQQTVISAEKVVETINTATDEILVVTDVLRDVEVADALREAIAVRGVPVYMLIPPGTVEENASYVAGLASRRCERAAVRSRWQLPGHRQAHHHRRTRSSAASVKPTKGCPLSSSTMPPTLGSSSRGSSRVSRWRRTTRRSGSSDAAPNPQCCSGFAWFLVWTVAGLTLIATLTPGGITLGLFMLGLAVVIYFLWTIARALFQIRELLMLSVARERPKATASRLFQTDDEESVSFTADNDTFPDSTELYPDP